MNTLKNKQVTETLLALHEKANADRKQRQQDRQQAAADGKTFDHSWATAYLAVGAEEGRLLYFLANVAKARSIVEFGCSFGISTIYLAAAARDNGGRIITTDLEENKVAGARKNIDAAGLGDLVEIRQGDAMQTLNAIEKPIDFLFLDGAKELYLPVFELLRPSLRPGSIVFADNTDKPETWPLVDYLTSATTEWTAIHLLEGRALVASMI